MKVRSNRQVYRLGYIDVLHKESGKVIPISPSLFKNKDRMLQLGYEEIVKPEAPKLEKAWNEMNKEERDIYKKKKEAAK